MHCALAINHIKGLVGIVAMHIVPIPGFGVNVKPGMKLLGVKDYFSFAFFMGHLDHVHNFYWHNFSPSLIFGKPYQPAEEHAPAVRSEVAHR
jgi:hypothetical protein